MFLRTSILCFGLLYMISIIDGHGRLMDPPSRVSAWRENPNEFIRENDDQGWWCGGRQVQIELGGKCGVCGDAWNATKPRPSEAGGKFANPEGKIVRSYKKGQIVEVNVEITVNHCGYFEFKLCPVSDGRVPITQECLDRNTLSLSGGSGTKWDIGHCSNGFPVGSFKVSLQLPKDLTCDHCVLQWRYVTANHCMKRTGCGPQEEFRACADIKIGKDGSSGVDKITTTTSTKSTTVDGSITGVDCSKSGFIGDTKACSPRFYRCIPIMEGGWRKIPFTCSTSLIWNQALTTCDWAFNVAGC